jgi:hypothetical protein
MNKAVTWGQRLRLLGLALALSAAAGLGLANGVWGLAILGGLLALAFWVAAWQAFALPLRPRTHYERFEARYDRRVDMILIGGLAGLLLAYYVFQPNPILLGVAMAVWLAVLVYSIRQARWRGEGVNESPEAYRKRMGYIPPSDDDKPTP